VANAIDLFRTRFDSKSYISFTRKFSSKTAEATPNLGLKERSLIPAHMIRLEQSLIAKTKPKSRACRADA
jgi:hypothetical protein